MALKPSHFIASSGGDFAEDHFPGVDLRLLLGKWLGHVSKEDEPVQRAYVNWRAERHIWKRMVRNRGRVDVEGKGSAQYFVSQIQDQKVTAKAARANVPARLIAIVEGKRPESGSSSGSRRRLRSGSVPTNTSW